MQNILKFISAAQQWVLIVYSETGAEIIMNVSRSDAIALIEKDIAFEIA